MTYKQIAKLCEKEECGIAITIGDFRCLRDRNAYKHKEEDGKSNYILHIHVYSNRWVFREAGVRCDIPFDDIKKKTVDFYVERCLNMFVENKRELEKEKEDEQDVL